MFGSTLLLAHSMIPLLKNKAIFINPVNTILLCKYSTSLSFYGDYNFLEMHVLFILFQLTLLFPGTLSSGTSGLKIITSNLTAVILSQGFFVKIGAVLQEVHS